MAKKKMNSKRNYITVLFAMGCLTLLEICALLKGVNGTIFSIIIALIAGLGGYVIPMHKSLQE